MFFNWWVWQNGTVVVRANFQFMVKIALSPAVSSCHYKLHENVICHKKNHLPFLVSEFFMIIILDGNESDENCCVYIRVRRNCNIPLRKAMHENVDKGGIGSKLVLLYPNCTCPGLVNDFPFLRTRRVMDSSSCLQFMSVLCPSGFGQLLFCISNCTRPGEHNTAHSHRNVIIFVHRHLLGKLSHSMMNSPVEFHRYRNTKYILLGTQRWNIVIFF